MMKVILAIDIGATQTKTALVSRTGRILRKTTLPTSAFRRVKSLVNELLRSRDLLVACYHPRPVTLIGMGLGIPGIVDVGRGIVDGLVNIPNWKNVPLREILRAKFKLPVFIDNDVNTMAWGEYCYGAGKGSRSMVALTLGTGVGGGIIIEGKLYRGSNFAAGEVGHIPIAKTGPRCNCGGIACLERFVGNRYLVGKALAAIKAGEKTSLAGLVGGKLSRIDPRIIEEAALRGDRLARRIWHEAGEDIGVALVAVINLLNPERIIIGGGVAKAGELIFKPIRQAIRRRVKRAPMRKVRIIPARLGEDAGLAGAAALIFREPS